MTKLKAVVMTSNSYRHKYFARAISAKLDLVGIVAEPKHEYFSNQRAGSDRVARHFENLASYEKSYFDTGAGWPDADVYEVEANRINDADVVQWVKDKQPDYICLFGTGILKEPFLSMFENRIVNLHLGLSPRYRGAATLFWPFVNDDIENGLGVTIHLAVRKVDAGAVLKIVQKEYAPEENYYQMTNGLMRAAMDVFADTVKAYASGEIKPVEQDIRTAAKAYTKADFNEQILERVMHRYGPRAEQAV